MIWWNGLNISNQAKELADCGISPVTFPDEIIKVNGMDVLIFEKENMHN